MTSLFDPSKYGAIPVESKNSVFDVSKYGGVRVTPPDEIKKETIWSNIKDVARNVPGAMKQIATEPFTHPIKTLQAVTAGVGDVGVSATNLGLSIGDKLMGNKAVGFRLPYLTQALADAQSNQEQSDVLSSIGNITKMVTAYNAGGSVLGKFKPTSVLGKLSKGALGNVIGGQIVTDADATLKERSSQALFDAAFSIVTEGLPMGVKKIFGKKVPIPKEKLTHEQYAAQQGYEPYVNPDNLPVIKAGKTPKESTVRYGKSNPQVFDGAFNPTTGERIAPVGEVKTNFETPKNQFDSEGFRPVNPDEVLPNGYTTKMNQTTGETLTNAPYSKTFEETVQTATPKFKEKVVKQAINLEEPTNPFNDAPLDRTPGRLIRASTKFEYTMEQPNGEQTIKDIISGKVQDPDISRQSAYGLLEKRYVKDYPPGPELDAKILGLKPNFETVVSKTGQNLGDLRQGMGSESPSLNINKAERLREMNLEKQGINIKDVKFEIKGRIEQALKDLSEGKSSQEIINKLVDEFTC